MSFTTKAIRLTFKLGKGSYGESGYDTVTVEGLRVRADITQVGGATMGHADVIVYGLTPDLLNQLTALWILTKLERFNSLTIEAGDSDGMSTVFQGQITAAWADLNAVPNSMLHVTANAAYLDAVKPATPTSYPSSADVADIMATLASKMGVAFENNGVSVTLSRPYLHGTLWQQVTQVAEAADINYAVDTGTLAIWPKDGSRGNQPVADVSAEKGMVGYPAFNSRGIAVTTLLDTKLRIGNLVKVTSILKQATGNWTIWSVSHSLESQTPGGQWFTHFQGSPPGDTIIPSV